MGPTYFSLQVDVSTFSFLIFNVLFPLGPWSQRRWRPSEGRAEQQNCQDAEPRGPGDRHRGRRPHHRLRCGCGFFILIHYFYFPVKSHIGRFAPQKKKNANNINVFSIWFVFWCSQKITKMKSMICEVLSCFTFYSKLPGGLCLSAALLHHTSSPDVLSRHFQSSL